MATTTLAPGLARKLKKVLETRTDSPELLASLGALSSFYTENTAQARRNLRSTIERRGLAINEEFLKASEQGQKALDAVEAEVEGLAACCERIAKALSSCSASTGDMVVATERLKQELESTTRRQELVSSFLQSYQLTPEEINALREEELDERFFKALARVQEIHSNCKMLLRTHHQRAGLELMDVMAVYQEGAYERLCRWVQAECRVLGDTDTPEVSDLLKTAARSLKDRPILFKYCAEEVANTRRNALFQRFVFALTRGGPGGMPRPIEVHAHDPLRYVGDMLAWLYQALASERELATALFSVDDSMGTTSRRFSRGGDQGERVEEHKVEADMASVLDRVFEGVCRPFKIRVEQVLTSQPGLIVAYKLSNLLAFYSHTVAELLGKDAALTATLHEVTESATRTFYDIMKQRGDKLLRYPPPVAVDLSPPPAVAEVMSTVMELMDTYEKAMVPSSAAKPDFEPVMAATLDPLLQMCERAAEAYGSKTPIPNLRRLGSNVPEGGFPSNLRRDGKRNSGDGVSGKDATPEGLQGLRNVFMINCLATIQQPLMPRSAAVTRVRALTEAIEARIAAVVDYELVSILSKCGLDKKVAIIKARGLQPSVGEIESDSNRPLSHLEDMSALQVAESLRSLFSLLATSPGGALPEFELMQVPRLRREASSRVATALADAYATVYRAVLDPSNGYPEPRTMLRHTPDQMRTILGI